MWFYSLGLIASFWEFPSVDAPEPYKAKDIVPTVTKFANQNIGKIIFSQNFFFFFFFFFLFLVLKFRSLDWYLFKKQTKESEKTI
jgi:hypothetical protein